ncbi:MAG: hypothetical protein M3552_20850 [Planctomycetota bacterium]|nr:hypothetical protein [Planctomycetaceae bacterium]MDQ3333066.1 hypothetical protein [Planctomycetota bacterium]
MTRSFKSADLLLLVAFAMGLAAVDGFSRRGGSSCPQCELELMQRSAHRDSTIPQPPSLSLSGDKDDVVKDQ